MFKIIYKHSFRCHLKNYLSMDYNLIPGLYIHIPYCYSKCDYCDFFSLPCHCVPDAYIDSLLNEYKIITASGEFLPNLNIKNPNSKTILPKLLLPPKINFSTIYIGGGNPGLLSPIQLKKILSTITNQTPPPKEVTIEVNPESVTKEWLEVAKTYGVTRLSLGVQSLNEKALFAVSRSTTLNATIKALNLINKYFLEDDNYTLNNIRTKKKQIEFNVDLIAGLPFDTSKTIISTIEKVLSYNPTHISFYQLTIESGTPLFKKIAKGALTIDKDKNNEYWLLGRNYLTSHGFKQYEVSNFHSATGNPSLHNMGYWRQQSYIALGAGGTSSIYFNATKNNLRAGVRWTNTLDIKKYINSLSSCTNNLQEKYCDIEYLDEKTLIFEYFMLGLRTTSGVSIKDFKSRYGHGIPPAIIDIFNKWKMEHLATVTHDNLKLTSSGLLILDKLLVELL